MNYTLVVPPFHRHPRMELFVVDQKTAEKDKYEPKVNVPIFDTMYEERFRKLSTNYDQKKNLIDFNEQFSLPLAENL